MPTLLSHPQTRPARARQKGNSILEFALVVPFFMFSFLGVTTVGLTMNREIQVNTITRDTAHMFFDGVDFSVTSNQTIVGRLAYGMGLSSDAVGDINTSGNGIVILTQVLMVGANDCINGGYSNGSCPNLNDLVIEKRIVIGNPTLRGSAFGTPSANLITSTGSITPANYTTDPTVVVTGSSPARLLGLAAGQYTYIVESYFVTPTLSAYYGNSAYAYAMM